MPDLENIIRAYFVGAYGENDECLEKIFIEFLRDHIYWRRNFHPKDKWRIPTSAQYSEEFFVAIADLKKELHDLSAGLKNTTPFFSPRYIGHMASDLLIPGLLAQLITTLYNPNNIALDAAPVTVPLELQVGRQLCRMVGYNLDEKQSPCAWGHLTSGGTISNYEGLLICRTMKLYPLAILRAAKSLKKLSVLFGNRQLRHYSPYELINLSIDEIIDYTQKLRASIKSEKKHGAEKLREFFQRVEECRVEAAGLGSFFNDLEMAPPVLLAPSTIHYSLHKAVKILGLGENNLKCVQVDGHFRLDMKDLKRQINRLHKANTPILGAIAVLGTTELGSVDPIDKIVELRNTVRRENQIDFYLHIDAAWGGYLSTLFHEKDGNWINPRDSDSASPLFSREVCEAFLSIRHADSITVDPHKLGYLPFGSGGIVIRNRETAQFLRQDAPYVWREDNAAAHTTSGMLQSQHGKFILEGSRPGANAAAIYVTHQVLPLNKNGFGRIVERTMEATREFRSKIDQLKREFEASKIARVCVPVEPQTNIVCYTINPYGNRCPTCLMKFTEELLKKLQLSRDPSLPLQTIQFLGSRTYLTWADMPIEIKDRIIQQLNLDSNTVDSSPPGTGIIILRHTLMNPWLAEKVDGDYYYLEEYRKYMKEISLPLCAAANKVWKCNECKLSVRNAKSARAV
ncbi:pyridoxal-dependent decarboxylase [Nitrospirales bacterium NOB]|nr:pyridoxal-dependent decarboxylase [Nitrospirales bacterium NOB]